MLLLVALLAYLLWPKPQIIVLPGLVQAQETSNASKVGGRVKAILVQEGSRVARGQVLITFDDTGYIAQLVEAQATLAQAKARTSLMRAGAQREDLSQAKSQVQQAREKLHLLRDGSTPESLKQAQATLTQATSQAYLAQEAFEKAKTLLQNGVISQQKYDALAAQAQTAQSALESAKASASRLKRGNLPQEIAIARAQLTSAQAGYQKLAKGALPEEIQVAEADVAKAQSALLAVQDQVSEMNLKSPINGVVTVLNVKPGELVPPGRPVVSVMDTRRLWTDIYVPESKLAGVSPNMPVEALVNVYGRKKFRGKIVFISPQSEFVPSGSGRASFSEESSFRVKVLLAPLDTTATVRLKPGMKIDVRVELQ
ncbi:MAG: efflux RND transporter periplasmic adaptor subunit [Vampirovibrionales bacterium]|nr:efflux RND transporter periplasmic adaptor subunit [Vampirovibrionales bacterium]